MSQKSHLTGFRDSFLWRGSLGHAGHAPAGPPITIMEWRRNSGHRHHQLDDPTGLTATSHPAPQILARGRVAVAKAIFEFLDQSHSLFSVLPYRSLFSRSNLVWVSGIWKISGIATTSARTAGSASVSNIGLACLLQTERRGCRKLWHPAKLQ